MKRTKLKMKPLIGKEVVLPVPKAPPISTFRVSRGFWDGDKAPPRNIRVFGVIMECFPVSDTVCRYDKQVAGALRCTFIRYVLKGVVRWHGGLYHTPVPMYSFSTKEYDTYKEVEAELLSQAKTIRKQLRVLLT